MTRPISIPVTSEEPFASVLRILQLREKGDDQFEAHSLHQVRRVYGGQVLAQALLAAAATLDDPDRLPHSFHAYFERGGDPSLPFQLIVNRARDGRSFSTRTVSCQQDGREILTLSTSFQGAEPGFEFFSSSPEVTAPEELTSALELFRTIDHPVGRFLGKTAAFDIRHVEESLYIRSDPTRHPWQHVWVRPRSDVPADMPQIGHRALLAYVIDQVMVEPAMRVFGLSWMTPGMSAASLDHAMWFHRDVNIGQWLLFDQQCTMVGAGRALTTNRVFTRSGALIAEATQQMMLRVPLGDRHGSGKWGFGAEQLVPKDGDGAGQDSSQPAPRSEQH